MSTLGKIFLVLYGLAVTVFGLVLFVGILLLRFATPYYLGVTAGQQHLAFIPFWFWQYCLIGIVSIISGILTIWKPSTWLVIASATTALFFFLKLLTLGVVASDWHWYPQYFFDIMATLVALVPYLLYRFTTRQPKV